MNKPIIVGIDGQPASAIALDWAIAEAAGQGLRLMVMHVGEAWSRPGNEGSLLTAQQTHGQQVVAEAAAVIQAANQIRTWAMEIARSLHKEDIHAPHQD